MSSCKREVFVFAVCGRRAFLSEVGGAAEIPAGHWGARTSCRWGRWHHCSFSSLSGTCMVQDFMFKLSGFPLQKSSKMEANVSALLIWKQTVISPLWTCCSSPRAGGRDYTLDITTGQMCLNFTPKPNARYRLWKRSKASQRQRYTSLESLSLKGSDSCGLLWWGCRNLGQMGAKDGLEIMGLLQVTIDW